MKLNCNPSEAHALLKFFALKRLIVLSKGNKQEDKKVPRPKRLTGIFKRLLKGDAVKSNMQCVCCLTVQKILSESRCNFFQSVYIFMVAQISSVLFKRLY